MQDENLIDFTRSQTFIIQWINVSTDLNVELSYEPAFRTYKLIDTHVHWVDFLQNTEGMQALLGQMDEIGLEKVVIFGLLFRFSYINTIF